MLLLMSFKDWLSVLVRTNFTFLLLFFFFFFFFHNDDKQTQHVTIVFKLFSMLINCNLFILLLKVFPSWARLLVLLLNVFISCTQICVSSTAVIFLFYISSLFLVRVFFTILQIYRFNNYAMKNFYFAIHELKLRQQSG